MKAKGLAAGIVATGFTAMAMHSTSATAAEWEHAVTPYLWMAGMDGTTAIGTPLGPLEADLDLPFSEVMENLKMGAMLSYRGSTGRYVVLADFIFMNLGAKDDLHGPITTQFPGLISGQAQVSMKQLLAEADFGYEVSDWLTVLAGLRYNELDSSVDLEFQYPSGVTGRGGKAGASWLDPVVGGVIEHDFSPAWGITLRGDIGGFGVGSEFAWQMMLLLRWHVTDELDISAGYRYIDVDYEDNGDSGIVKYDVASQGPGIGLTFRF